MLTAGRAAGAKDSRSSSDRQRIESSPRAARAADDIAVYGVDKTTGYTLWTYESDTATPFDFGYLRTVAKVDGVSVAFLTDTSSGLTIHAVYVDGVNAGTAKWTRALSGSLFSGHVPAVSDGVVYFGSGSTSPYQLHAASVDDGSDLWVHELTSGIAWGGGITVHGGPVTPTGGGRVYFGDQAGNVNMVRRLEISHAVTSRTSWTYAAGGSPNTPTVDCTGPDGACVVYATANSDLHAINADTGVGKWTFTGDTVLTHSPTVADGVVYIGDEAPKVYAIDTSAGSEIWSFETEDSVYSTPIVHEGVVYAGDGDNKMYAINKDTGAQERGCLADVGFANRRSDFLDNGFVFENMEGQVCVPAGA